MKTVMVFIAGTMFLSTAFAQDPGFEERYRMKMGRYTPAEEARREAVKTAATKAPAEPVMDCAKPGCCDNPKQQAATTKADVAAGDPGADARFKMKFGRTSASEESRTAAATRAGNEPILVASANMCERGCCKHAQ